MRIILAITPFVFIYFVPTTRKLIQSGLQDIILATNLIEIDLGLAKLILALSLSVFILVVTRKRE